MTYQSLHTTCFAQRNHGQHYVNFKLKVYRGKLNTVQSVASNEANLQYGLAYRSCIQMRSMLVSLTKHCLTG